jgi:cytochrome bd-type quinol oxidase subunit 2
VADERGATGGGALGRPAREATSAAPGTTRGPGRVLVALYGVFALAAGARAAVQLSTQFDEAPLAYLLSAVAAVVYVIATIGLARGGRGGRRTAVVSCSIELAGVLVVGTLSLLDPAAFPDATVWSGYGQGYGYVPLLLPVLGLLWLRHQSRLAQAQGDGPDRTG